MADWKDHIEKYVRGELTPSERHALEKQALSDRFLADALYGAESISRDEFSRDIEDLNSRIAQKNKRLSRWSITWRIAASIALLAGSYTLYTVTRQTVENPKLSEQSFKTAPQELAKAATDDSTTEVKKQSSDKLLTYTPSSRPEGQAQRQSAPEEKPRDDRQPIVGLSEVDRQDTVMVETSGSVPTQSGIAVTQSADAPSASKADQVGPGDEKEVERESKVSGAKKKSAGEAARLESGNGLANRSKAGRTITGRITSSEDGAGIPGANVSIAGTGNGTVSDANGDFEITSTGRRDSLEVSFIGYQSKNVSIPANAPVNVSLQPDISQLNEVVVVGTSSPSTQLDDEEKSVRAASPVDGSKSFNQYIKGNLKYPADAINNKVAGTVVVDFVVQPTGVMSDFTIVQGIGHGCDEEAIRLIKDGPAWRAAVSGKVPIKSTVRVRIKFKIPK